MSVDLVDGKQHLYYRYSRCLETNNPMTKFRKENWNFTFFRSCLIVIFGITVSSNAFTQSQFPLIYDNDQSHYFGAYNSIFVHKAIYSFQDNYIPDTLRREIRLSIKCVGFGYRMAKLFLLDFQEDFLFGLIQHEAFGHAARWREFGSKNNSVTVNLFFPFGDGSGSTQFGNVVGNFTPHKNLALSIGGVEANMVLANTLCYNFLQSDSIHYRQALLYLISQNDQLLYIWSDRIKGQNTNGGGDMLGYVSNLNNLYNPTQNPYTIEKLSIQSIVSVISPIQIYSAFTLFYSYGLMGKKYLSKIPMIRFGNVRYLPYLNYNLSPFGSEYLFCNAVKYKNKLLIADMGIGENTFNNFYRLRIKLFNLLKNNKVGMNLHVDAWNQPELELEPNANTKTENQIGGAVKIDFMLHPFQNKNNISLYTQLGYKTKGFIIGEPLAETFILRYGISFHF